MMREWVITVYGTGRYRCYELKAETADAAMDLVSAILRREGVQPPYTLDVHEWISAERRKRALVPVEARKTSEEEQ